MTPQDDPIEQSKAMRRWAERRAARNPDILATMTPEEIQHLVHELQVHQIELEMQNENLLLEQTQLDAVRERYFDLYDLAPVGYLSVSEKGIILESNLTAATLLEVPRRELNKRPLPQFIHREDEDIYYLHRKQLVKTSTPQQCELRMLKSGENPFWAQLDITAAQNDDGAPICRVALHDITEHKQAEEAVRKSEVKYRDLAENLEGILWEYDYLTDCWTYVSPQSERILGYTPEEWTNFDWWTDRIHREDRKEAVSFCEAQTREGKPHDLEYRFFKKNGEIVWLKDVATVKMQDGKPVSSRGMMTDITDRKQSEQKLRESEEKQKNLIQNLQAGVVVHGPDTHIILANERASELLGLTIDQMMGKVVTDPAWCFIHEDETPLHIEEYPVARVFATKSPIQNRVVGIVRPQEKDRVWVVVTAFPEFASDGKITQVVVTFTDITERKQAEEALKESERKFRELFEKSADA